MSSTLIGLTGYAQHGKSTVAEILVEQHGFVRMSFAAELKAMLRRVDPIIDDKGGLTLTEVDIVFNGDENFIKKAFPEYRRLMRSLGTEGIRAVDEDFWVRILRTRIRDHINNHPGVPIVVDDVRFPNEAALFSAIIGAKTELWYVNRPGHPDPSGGHESEQWAGKMSEDREIDNDSTLEVLADKVRELVETKVAE